MGIFLGGRSDRLEYWTSVGLLTAAGFVLPMLHIHAAVVALAVMWVVTWVRRLHDIDMSGGVTLVPGAVLVALVAGGFVFGGHDFVNALKDSQSSRTALPVSESGLFI